MSLPVCQHVLNAEGLEFVFLPQLHSSAVRCNRTSSGSSRAVVENDFESSHQVILGERRSGGRQERGELEGDVEREKSNNTKLYFRN